jgi:hypothetical protein
MNFIPEFLQVLSATPHESEEAKWSDFVGVDETKEEPIRKYYCWVTLQEWLNCQTPLLVIYKEKCQYKVPKTTSLYKYNGPLLSVTTHTSENIIKPSSTVVCNSLQVKAKTLEPGMHLTRVYLSQLIEKIETVSWEGQLVSLFFGENCLLPIKYTDDYILIPC